MVNTRGGWKLVTFDPDSYFRIFQAHIPLQWLDLAILFLVWGYIFRISRTVSSFKVMGLRSRSHQQKTHAQVSAPLGHSLVVFCFIYSLRL